MTDAAIYIDEALFRNAAYNALSALPVPLLLGSHVRLLRMPDEDPSTLDRVGVGAVAMRNAGRDNDRAEVLTTLGRWIELDQYHVLVTGPAPDLPE